MSSSGLAVCGQCLATIRWTITDGGKRSAMNPAPDTTGNTAVYRDALGVWRSRRPTDELPITPWEKLHTPHVATCKPRTARAEAARALPAGVTDLTAHRRNRRPRR